MELTKCVDESCIISITKYPVLQSCNLDRNAINVLTPLYCIEDQNICIWQTKLPLFHMCALLVYTNCVRHVVQKKSCVTNTYFPVFIDIAILTP